MLLAPKPEAMRRREEMVRSGGRAHPYAGAMAWCREQSLLPETAQPEQPVTALPEGLFEPTEDLTRRGVYTAYKMG